MRILKLTATLLVTTLLALSAWAGKESGGGMVAVFDGKTYLYDFYESGLQDLATAGDPLPDQMGATRILQASLLASPRVISILSNKLNQIYRRSTPTARLILNAIRRLQWQIVQPNVANTFDLGKSPLRIENGVNVYQVALRDDSTQIVWININHWNALNEINKAGLIFHEALYAIASQKMGHEDSYKSRMLNAFLFDPRFALKTPTEVFQRLRDVVPAAALVSTSEDDWQIDTDFARACENYRGKIWKDIEIIGTYAEFYSKLVEQKFAKYPFQHWYSLKVDFRRSFTTIKGHPGLYPIPKAEQKNLPVLNVGEIYEMGQRHFRLFEYGQITEFKDAKTSLAQNLLKNEDFYENRCLSESDLDMAQRVLGVLIYTLEN